MTSIDLRPLYSVEEAERITQDCYGLIGKLSELPSERDQNFLVHTDDKRKFVLKISNKGEPKAVLRFQNQVLSRIKSYNASITVPEVVRSVKGKRISQTPGLEGSKHFVRLLTFLPGQMMVTIEGPKEELHVEIGGYMGHLDKALIGYWHPMARRSLLWSIYLATEVIEDGIKYLEDRERTAVVESFLIGFQANVVPILHELPSGVIHNDANDHNVIVNRSASGKYRISGLIDFGDMVYGPYIYEPAVASAYAILGEDDVVAPASRIIHGYHRIFPLSESEIKMLYYLIGIRLCTSVVLSAKRRKKSHDDEYLQISEKPAWRALYQLVALQPPQVANRFLEACHLSP